jgi:undecaprenyl-diphosphatase
MDSFMLMGLRKHKDFELKNVAQADVEPTEKPSAENEPEKISDTDFSSLVERFKQVLGERVTDVRSSNRLADVDDSVAQWGFDHAGDLSDAGLRAVTTLGETWFVIVAAIALVLWEWYRKRPTRWVAAYLACVIVGQNVLTRTIKDLADRVRPDLNPIAESLGPSFPSGHSATAAAFYAAAALVLGRGRPRGERARLAGGAVAITVAVAGSRVLLDVHWLSDVVAGVALGWAWFAACSVAFGGRILRFGAAAERAGEQAVAEARAPRGSEAHP